MQTSTASTKHVDTLGRLHVTHAGKTNEEMQPKGQENRHVEATNTPYQEKKKNKNANTTSATPPPNAEFATSSSTQEDSAPSESAQHATGAPRNTSSALTSDDVASRAVHVQPLRPPLQSHQEKEVHAQPPSAQSATRAREKLDACAPDAATTGAETPPPVLSTLEPDDSSGADAASTSPSAGATSAAEKPPHLPDALGTDGASVADAPGSSSPAGATSAGSQSPSACCPDGATSAAGAHPPPIKNTLTDDAAATAAAIKAGVDEPCKCRCPLPRCLHQRDYKRLDSLATHIRRHLDPMTEADLVAAKATMHIAWPDLARPGVFTCRTPGCRCAWFTSPAVSKKPASPFCKECSTKLINKLPAEIVPLSELHQFIAKCCPSITEDVAAGTPTDESAQPPPVACRDDGLPTWHEVHRVTSFGMHFVPREATQALSLRLAKLLTEAHTEAGYIKLVMFFKLVLRRPDRGGLHNKAGQAALKQLKAYDTDLLGEWRKLQQSSDATTLKKRKGVDAATKEEVKLEQARVLVDHGFISRAFRLFSNGKVHASTPEVVAKLRELHPQAEPIDQAAILAADNFDVKKQCDPLKFSPDELIDAMRTFNRETASGPQQLELHVLKVLLESDATNALKPALLDFCGRAASGNLDSRIWPWFCSATLIPLKKNDGGVRPIAVGNILRRLVAKLIAARMKLPLSEHFDGLQFGVACPAGIDKIVHWIRENTHQWTDPNWKPGEAVLKDFPLGAVVLKVDIKNAFNTVAREAFIRAIIEQSPQFVPYFLATYGTPANLLLAGSGGMTREIILAMTGVQQGDPLAPACFSLAIHKIIKDLRDRHPNVAARWYLDDGAMIGLPKHVRAYFEDLSIEFKKIGLLVNFGKCQLHGPDTNTSNDALDQSPDATALGLHEWPEKVQRGYTNSPASMPARNEPVPPAGSTAELCAKIAAEYATLTLNTNVLILGVPVGCDEFARHHILDYVHERCEPTLGILTRWGDAHAAHTLLRLCAGFPRMVHCMRGCPPQQTVAAANWMDLLIVNTWSNIVGVRPDAAGLLQMSLPTRLGGLGLLSSARVVHAAYSASCAAAAPRGQDALFAAEALETALGQAGMVPESRGAGKNGGESPYYTQKALSHNIIANQVPELIHMLQQLPANKYPGHRVAIYEAARQAKCTWLCHSPNRYQSLALSHAQACALMKFVLGQGVYTEDYVCPRCQRSADHLGIHAITCRKRSPLTTVADPTLRHNWARDTIMTLCRRAQLTVRTEVSVTPGSLKRPCDVLIQTPQGLLGLDLVCFSPFTSARISKCSEASFQRMFDVEKLAKINKYKLAGERFEDVCVKFLPTPVTALGGYDTECDDIMYLIAGAIANRGSVLFGVALAECRSNFKFAVVRGTATILLNNLPHRAKKASAGFALAPIKKCRQPATRDEDRPVTTDDDDVDDTSSDSDSNSDSDDDDDDDSSHSSDDDGDADFVAAEAVLAATQAEYINNSDKARQWFNTHGFAFPQPCAFKDSRQATAVSDASIFEVRRLEAASRAHDMRLSAALAGAPTKPTGNVIPPAAAKSLVSADVARAPGHPLTGPPKQSADDEVEFDDDGGAAYADDIEEEALFVGLGASERTDESSSGLTSSTGFDNPLGNNCGANASIQLLRKLFAFSDPYIAEHVICGLDEHAAASFGINIMKALLFKSGGYSSTTEAASASRDLFREFVLCVRKDRVMLDPAESLAAMARLLQPFLPETADSLLSFGHAIPMQTENNTTALNAPEIFIGTPATEGAMMPTSHRINLGMRMRGEILGAILTNSVVRDSDPAKRHFVCAIRGDNVGGQARFYVINDGTFTDSMPLQDVIRIYGRAIFLLIRKDIQRRPAQAALAIDADDDDAGDDDAGDDDVPPSSQQPQQAADGDDQSSDQQRRDTPAQRPAQSPAPARSTTDDNQPLVRKQRLQSPSMPSSTQSDDDAVARLGHQQLTRDKERVAQRRRAEEAASPPASEAGHRDAAETVQHQQPQAQQQRQQCVLRQLDPTQQWQHACQQSTLAQNARQQAAHAQQQPVSERRQLEPELPQSAQQATAQPQQQFRPPSQQVLSQLADTDVAATEDRKPGLQPPANSSSRPAEVSSAPDPSHKQQQVSAVGQEEGACSKPPPNSSPADSAAKNGEDPQEVALPARQQPLALISHRNLYHNIVSSASVVSLQTNEQAQSATDDIEHIDEKISTVQAVKNDEQPKKTTTTKKNKKNTTKKLGGNKTPLEDLDGEGRVRRNSTPGNQSRKAGKTPGSGPVKVKRQSAKRSVAKRAVGGGISTASQRPRAKPQRHPRAGPRQERPTELADLLSGDAPAKRRTRGRPLSAAEKEEIAAEHDEECRRVRRKKVRKVDETATRDEQGPRDEENPNAGADAAVGEASCDQHSNSNFVRASPQDSETPHVEATTAGHQHHDESDDTTSNDNMSPTGLTSTISATSNAPTASVGPAPAGSAGGSSLGWSPSAALAAKLAAFRVREEKRDRVDGEDFIREMASNEKWQRSAEVTKTRKADEGMEIYIWSSSNNNMVSVEGEECGGEATVGDEQGEERDEVESESGEGEGGDEGDKKENDHKDEREHNKINENGSEGGATGESSGEVSLGRRVPDCSETRRPGNDVGDSNGVLTPHPPPAAHAAVGPSDRAIGVPAAQQLKKISMASGSRRMREEVDAVEATSGTEETDNESGEQQDRSDPDAAGGSTSSSRVREMSYAVGAANDSPSSPANSAAARDISTTVARKSSAPSASSDSS